MVERFTRWLEARDKYKDVHEALVSHWIACFGMPLDMTSDRGLQVMSKWWTAIAQLLDTKLHQITAYHPQENRLIEYFHQHLKSALQA